MEEKKTYVTDRQMRVIRDIINKSHRRLSYCEDTQEYTLIVDLNEEDCDVLNSMNNEPAPKKIGYVIRCKNIMFGSKPSYLAYGAQRGCIGVNSYRGSHHYCRNIDGAKVYKRRSAAEKAIEKNSQWYIEEIEIEIK